MSTLVVLGAGPIGRAAAQQAATGALAGRVVLVDPTAEVARGLALDLCQSGAVTGTSTLVEGTGDESAVVGARLVVVADAHGAPAAWTGDDGLRLVARVRTLNPGAFVLFAGPAHGPVVERAVAEHDADRAKLAGSAPEALRAAMTALTALEAGVAPGDVTLSIVGRSPFGLFVAWDGASIGGSRATDVLAPPVIAGLDRQTPYLWPPGPLTLGAAAARVAGLLLGRRPGLASLLAVPRSSGQAGRGVVLPAEIVDGTVRLRRPSLAPRDRTRLGDIAPA